MEKNGSFVIYENAAVIQSGLFVEDISKRVALSSELNATQVAGANLQSFKTYAVVGKCLTNRSSSAIFGKLTELSGVNGCVRVLTIIFLADNISDAVDFEKEFLERRSPSPVNFESVF